MIDRPSGSGEPLPKKEPITPQGAKERFIQKHHEYTQNRMSSDERHNPAYILNVMRNGVDYVLRSTSYDPGKKELYNMSLSSLTGGFLTTKPGETINSVHDIDKAEYNFGQGALKPGDVRELLGDEIDGIARQALRERKDPRAEGIARKEILPGFSLVFTVTDDISRYSLADTTAGDSRFRIGAAYAAVPLLGDVEVTGKDLVRDEIENFHDDFDKRYTTLVNNPHAPMQHWGSNIDGETTVSEIITNQKDIDFKSVHSGVDDPIAIASTPGVLSRTDQLFILALMQNKLRQEGRELDINQDAPLAERIARVGTIYKDIMAVKGAEQSLAEQNLDDAMRNREVLPPLTEEARKAIIDRNTEVLNRVFFPVPDANDIDADMKEAMSAVRPSETMILDDGSQEIALKILYRTSSGEISNPQKGYLPGDWSRLNTWVNIKGRTIAFNEEKGRWETTNQGRGMIRLTHPGNGPTISQLNEAMTGDSQPDEENRRLLPERMLPGFEQYMGPREPWGESHYTVNSEGDSVFLKSVQRFNRENAVND